MARRKIYSFAIDPDLSEGLKLVKERDGIAESEQIRRSIRAWLESKGVKSERKRPTGRKRS